jgi:glycerophosphoryl diester phosphodiesterase
VLGLFAGRVKAHIDIKEPGYEAEVLALATELVGLDRFVVTGEDAVVRASKRACPEAYAGLSLGRGVHEVPLARLVQVRSSEWWPLRRVRACGADAVAMHHRLARAGALRTVARNGIAAMIWTVNDPVLIRRFVRDPRVDVLITDRPELALAERAS